MPGPARLTTLPPAPGAPLRYDLGGRLYAFSAHAAGRCAERELDARQVVLLLAALVRDEGDLACAPEPLRLRLDGRLSAVAVPTPAGWHVITVIRHGRIPTTRQKRRFHRPVRAAG